MSDDTGKSGSAFAKATADKLNPAALRIEDAAKALGISEDMLQEDLAAGVPTNADGTCPPGFNTTGTPVVAPATVGWWSYVNPTDTERPIMIAVIEYEAGSRCVSASAQVRHEASSCGQILWADAKQRCELGHEFLAQR